MPLNPQQKAMIRREVIMRQRQAARAFPERPAVPAVPVGAGAGPRTFATGRIDKRNKWARIRYLEVFFDELVLNTPTTGLTKALNNDCEILQWTAGNDAGANNNAFLISIAYQGGEKITTDDVSAAGPIGTAGQGGWLPKPYLVLRAGVLLEVIVTSLAAGTPDFIFSATVREWVPNNSPD
jgi:hypothetical protein